MSPVNIAETLGLPSGKDTKKLWKDPPFFMGKSTISRGIFNSKLLVYQRVYSVVSQGFRRKAAVCHPCASLSQWCAAWLQRWHGRSCWWFHTFKWATFMAFMANKHLEKDDWQGKKLGYPLFGQSLCSVLAAYLCCICRSRCHAIRRSTRGGAKVHLISEKTSAS